MMQNGHISLLTAFSTRRYVLALLLFRTVFQPPASRFEARSSLTRLVKAEIVTPYFGILINTGLGNPTGSFARPLENRRVLRLVRGRLIFTAFIRG